MRQLLEEIKRFPIAKSFPAPKSQNATLLTSTVCGESIISLPAVAILYTVQHAEFGICSFPVGERIKSSDPLELINITIL